MDVQIDWDFIKAQLPAGWADRRSERFLSAHPLRHGLWGTLVAHPGAYTG